MVHCLTSSSLQAFATSGTRCGPCKASSGQKLLNQRQSFLGGLRLTAGNALLGESSSKHRRMQTQGAPAPAIVQVTAGLFSGSGRSQNGNGSGKSNEETLTTAAGQPVGDNQNSLTAGRHGPLLLAEDIQLYEKNAHFNRERVPPRVVHEQGTGAFGSFTVTQDITKYTKAKLFSEVGKKTDIFVRFSTVSGEHGTADSIRDPRGFPVKFYTEEGNWDLVGNNTPIFFIRDPMKFPDLIHSQKRDGRGLKSWTMRWDFWSLNPESTHQVLWLMGDRGLPASYRNMNGYGSHTFSLINKENQRTWVKFHYKSQQGVKGFTDEEGMKLAGENPDMYAQDLFNSIAEGNFPKWKFYIQVMTEDQARQLPFDAFDLTTVWPHKEFPLIEVGEFELNKNPTNYFQDVEQAAFSPANVVPGISFSPDRVLQGRLFAYKDAHFYRVGVNYDALPVNKPRCPVHNYHIDGAMRFDGNHGLGPTYEPNSFNGPRENPAFPVPPLPISSDGDGWRYNHQQGADNFFQAKKLWALMESDERERVIKNITNNLSQGLGAGLKSEPVPEFIQKTVVYNFYQVDEDLGKELASKLGLSLEDTLGVGEKRQKERVYALR